MSESKPVYEVIRNRLWDELVHLHDVWDQYLSLYGHGPERVQLLNESARSFFAGLQRMMIREAMLCISRLTDPAQPGGGKNNLVLAVLLDDPKLDSSPKLKAKLSKELNRAKSGAAPIRKHRNRYIAHLDHATAIGAPDDPLPSVTRAAVEKVIQQMEAFYHRHSSELYDSDRVFELSSLGGTSSLIKALERARQWRKHENTELKREYGIEAD
jgi:hypothetical protein